MERLKVKTITSTSRGNGTLFEQWKRHVPAQSSNVDGQPYRIMGLFRADSVNISLAQASEERVRRAILGNS